MMAGAQLLVVAHAVGNLADATGEVNQSALQNASKVGLLGSSALMALTSTSGG